MPKKSRRRRIRRRRHRGGDPENLTKLLDEGWIKIPGFGPYDNKEDAEAGLNITAAAKEREGEKEIVIDGNNKFVGVYQNENTKRIYRLLTEINKIAENYDKWVSLDDTGDENVNMDTVNQEAADGEKKAIKNFLVEVAKNEELKKTLLDELELDELEQTKKWSFYRNDSLKKLKEGLLNGEGWEWAGGRRRRKSRRKSRKRRKSRRGKRRAKRRTKRRRR